jgi:hypothetical protein
MAQLHMTAGTPAMTGHQEQMQAEERHASALRGKHPEWKIFRIAGGWGAVRDHLEIARTASTLDELDTRLAEFSP